MTLFVICFGVGLLFLIISALLGGLGDFGFHVDIGGHDVDFGGGGAEGGGAHFSPFSPLIISFFLTVFGGMGGLSMSLWQITFGWSLLIALVSALGSAVAIYLFLCKVFATTEGGVEVNVSELVGREADVITGIPRDGVGEIAFITSGGRLNGPARSADGNPIPFNTAVKIVKIVGSTYIVQRLEMTGTLGPQAPAGPAGATGDSNASKSGE